MESLREREEVPAPAEDDEACLSLSLSLCLSLSAWTCLLECRSLSLSFLSFLSFLFFFDFFFSCVSDRRHESSGKESVWDKAIALLVSCLRRGKFHERKIAALKLGGDVLQFGENSQYGSGKGEMAHYKAQATVAFASIFRCLVHDSGS